MSDLSVTCPSCRKRFKAPAAAAGRTTACPNCSGNISIPSKPADDLDDDFDDFDDDIDDLEFPDEAAAAKDFPPGPPPPPPPANDDRWFILDNSGKTYGPFDFNDVQNSASQGRLTIETSVRHEVRTNNKWVSVSRVPEIAELMQTAAAMQIQLANAATLSHRAANPEFPRTASVPILISAIANIVMAVFWICTCYGFLLAIPCIVLCIYEIRFYGRRLDYDREQFRSVTLLLGIFEMVVGLCNLISFVCGIVVLVTRPTK